MTDYASFADLTTTDAIGVDFTLPSGRLVRVRGLSRYEWFLIGKQHGDDGNAAEAAFLAAGMVTPELSVAKAVAWRKVPGAGSDVAAVMQRIKELTGVTEEIGRASC